MRRHLAVLAVALASWGCAAKVSRTDVVDGYRRELVRQGVLEPQARCLTEKFFAPLSDDELRAFQKRDALTDAEKQQFAQLADVCAGAT